MALKFFDDANPTSGQLPFLDEFVKNAKNLKQDTYQVSEIRRVQSDKGYLVVTEKFTCFIWKNAKTTKQLIEALDFYINSDKGYAVCVFLPDVKKSEFRLGVDFDTEVTWFTSKNGFTITQEESNSAAIDGTSNPFLPS